MQRPREYRSTGSILVGSVRFIGASLAFRTLGMLPVCRFPNARCPQMRQAVRSYQSFMVMLLAGKLYFGSRDEHSDLSQNM